VRKVEHTRIEIDVLPPERHDFQPAAGEDQQHHRGDRRRHLQAFRFHLSQNLADAPQLGGAQEPLTLLLAVQVHRDMLSIEPRGQVLHRYRVAAGVALGQRIDTLAQRGEVTEGHCARLLRGHHVDVAQHHPARPAASAIQQNEALAAGRHHSHAEAGDVVVPGDVVDVSWRQRLDAAFGELSHAAVPDRQSATRSGCGASFSQHYVSKKEGNSS
jgi:hypothetical protein